MPDPAAHTPPASQDARPGPVRRRHVFYVPGYDPEARSRYRLLFVRELTRYAKRFGEAKREITRAVLSPDGLVQSWNVGALPGGGGAETTYDVLLWDDIVARDFARSKFVSVALLVTGTLHALAAGKLAAFYRLNWKYGNIILYPFVMVLLLAASAALIAAAAQAYLGPGHASGPGLPPWLALALGGLAGLAWIRAIEALLNRIFFWQLLNDWVFNWQHGQGWREDYDRRLDAFADRVLCRVAEFRAGGEAEGIDEILIVGHSSGALTAVEVAARVLARDPVLGVGTPTLALVTLGSGLPLVALQPRARRLRAEIASLVTSRRIVWVDYHAPQDWMNFPGFDPVEQLDLGLGREPAANPLVRSAKFREIISPNTYRKVRWRPFRMHFQFLMANDQRGDYDFFAMTLGPQRLRERVRASRSASAPAPAAARRP